MEECSPAEYSQQLASAVTQDPDLDVLFLFVDRITFVPYRFTGQSTTYTRFSTCMRSNDRSLAPSDILYLRILARSNVETYV